MNTLDIVFCYPLLDKVFLTEPVGLCFLVAYLNSKGLAAEIYDGFLRGDTSQQAAESLVASNPYSIGISMNAQREVQDGLIVARNTRELGFDGPIIAGGAFACMHQEELLNGQLVDYVVVGDGEEALLDLLRQLQAGEEADIPGIASRECFPATLRPGIRDLDALPWMDRSIFGKMIQHNGGSTSGIQATISTSRGCYARCAFCSIQTFARMNRGKRYRRRQIENVVAEMDELHQRFGVRDFYFCSGQFLGASKKTAHERSAALRRGVEKLGFNPSIFLYLRCDNIDAEMVEDIRRAGVTTIFLGVESFDDMTLLRLKKGLRSDQIIAALETLEAGGYNADYRSPHRLKLGFMMFTPWISLDGLKRNLKYCRRFRLPPKKMLYTLQLHSDSRLNKEGYDTSSREYIDFINPAGEIGAICHAYRQFFQTVFEPLERMRALQKSQLELPPSLEHATYQVVDAINDLAYEVFGEMIQAARRDDLAETLAQSQMKAHQLLKQLNVDELMATCLKATDVARVRCPESHLNRGLDNPQVIEPGNIEYGLRYP